jgi:hypothetical protein
VGTDDILEGQIRIAIGQAVAAAQRFVSHAFGNRLGRLNGPNDHRAVDDGRTEDRIALLAEDTHRILEGGRNIQLIEHAI